MKKEYVSGSYSWYIRDFTSLWMNPNEKRIHILLDTQDVYALICTLRRDSSKKRKYIFVRTIFSFKYSFQSTWYGWLARSTKHANSLISYYILLPIRSPDYWFVVRKTLSRSFRITIIHIVCYFFWVCFFLFLKRLGPCNINLFQ